MGCCTSAPMIRGATESALQESGLLLHDVPMMQFAHPVEFVLGLSPRGSPRGATGEHEGEHGTQEEGDAGPRRFVAAQGHVTGEETKELPFDLSQVVAGPMSAQLGAGAPAVRVLFVGNVQPLDYERVPLVSESVKRVVSSADLLVLNLAGVVSRVARQHRRTTSEGRHEMSADFFRNALGELGADPRKTLVSVANHHWGDVEEGDGLALSAANIELMGATTIGVAHTMRPGSPRDEDQRKHKKKKGRVAIVTVGGARLGIVAWTTAVSADERDPSAPVWSLEDVADMSMNWRGVKQKNNLALLVAFPHWVMEEAGSSVEEHALLARELVHRGFDVVVGHGTEALQTLERVDGSLCAYGLGNLMAEGKEFSSKFGCALELVLDARGTMVSYKMHTIALLVNGVLRGGPVAEHATTALVMRHEIRDLTSARRVRDRLGRLFDFQHSHVLEMRGAAARYCVRVRPPLPKGAVLRLRVRAPNGDELGDLLMTKSDAGTLLVPAARRLQGVGEVHAELLATSKVETIDLNAVSVLDLDSNEAAVFLFARPLQRGASATMKEGVVDPGPLRRLREHVRQAPLKTGDLLAMRSARWTSGVISTALLSRYSHVGIIVADRELGELLVFESTSNLARTPDASAGRFNGAGVFSFWLPERLATYSGLIDVLPLKQPLAPAFERAVIDYLRSCHVRRTPYAFKKMIRRGLRMRNNSDMHKMYCSELVASALYIAGLLPSDRRPADQAPSDIVALPCFGEAVSLLQLGE